MVVLEISLASYIHICIPILDREAAIMALFLKTYYTCYNGYILARIISTPFLILGDIYYNLLIILLLFNVCANICFH